jgi:hypothetical protein
MVLRRSIRGLALAVGIVVMTIMLACPLTLLLARQGLVTPPLVDVSFGPIGIAAQGETVASSIHPLRTFYGVWIYAGRRFLYQVARVEIPNEGRPIRWRLCRFAVRRAATVTCGPPPRLR